MQKHRIQRGIRFVAALGMALTGLWQAAPARMAQAAQPAAAPAQDARPGASALCFASLNSSNTTDYSSNDHAAVQQAVDAATSGSTIKLAGTCKGVTSGTLVNITSKTLTIIGGYTTTNWAAPVSGLQTTLDANGLGRVISSTSSLWLENVIIKNGLKANDTFAEFGAGGLFAGATFLSNTTFFNNVVSDYGAYVCSEGGGGAYASGSIDIVNSSFISNASTYHGGGLWTTGRAALTGTEFYQNSADISTCGGLGAGAYLNGSESIISNGVVASHTNNTAIVIGAGTWRVQNTHFFGNTGERVLGTGMSGSVSGSILDSIFENGSCALNLMSGSGVYIEGSTFRNLVCSSSGSGGSAVNSVIPTTISGTSFISNHLTVGEGSTVLVDWDISLTINNSTFISNVGSGSGRGAAVFPKGPLEMSGSTFIGNSASGGYGSAVNF